MGRPAASALVQPGGRRRVRAQVPDRARSRPASAVGRRSRPRRARRGGRLAVDDEDVAVAAALDPRGRPGWDRARHRTRPATRRRRPRPAGARRRRRSRGCRSRCRSRSRGGAMRAEADAALQGLERGWTGSLSTRRFQTLAAREDRAARQLGPRGPAAPDAPVASGPSRRADIDTRASDRACQVRVTMLPSVIPATTGSTIPMEGPSPPGRPVPRQARLTA